MHEIFSAQKKHVKNNYGLKSNFNLQTKNLIPKQTRLLFQLLPLPQFPQPIFRICLKMMSNEVCGDKFTTLKYPCKLLICNFSFLKEL